jgi:hypothetical protein
MALDFEIRAIQGTETAQTIRLSAGFNGTESLSLDVGVGDDQSAVTTLTPTWSSGQVAGSYTDLDVQITSTVSAALPWGAYGVNLRIDSSSVAAARGNLTVYPGAGGTGRPYQRLLASPAQAESYLPSMTRDQYDTLPVALVAATRAVEGYCQRPLVLSSYDHFIRPENTNRVRLRTRPVVELTRCAAGQQAAFWVANATADMASVNEVMATMGSLVPTSLVFKSTLAGTTTTQTLTVGSYATITLLVAAINALGNGWSATAYAPAASLPTSELFGTVGARDARGGRPEFFVSSQPLDSYWLNDSRGYIEVNQSIPGGFLVANPRREICDTRHRGVRCTYRAGYAYLKADSDLGYLVVPEDLAAATIMTAQSILEATPAMGPVKSQTVKDRSYVLRDSMDVIPEPAKAILARYAEFVL